MEIRPKVLITKIGLDGHDRGSRIVAAYLRDAGMEVIYTPPWQEIPVVVKIAAEEDVDIVGISSLATDHLIVPRLVAALRAAGVARVFHPGTPLADIAAYVREVTAQIRAGRRAPRRSSA
jgi:methylmalonyl-CoA mutase, C-terminal domain